jgi:transcriptional regulator with XRE-family HTH domain
MVAVAKNPVAVCFGKNLRACRSRAAISQEELGQRASLHRTEIGLLERGTRVPRIDTLIKIASALSIQPGELLVGIDWKSDSVQRGGFEFRSPGETDRT